MFGKMVDKRGQRDALVEHLLEASRLIKPSPSERQGNPDPATFF
jgi:hypothetical protein